MTAADGQPYPTVRARLHRVRRAPAVAEQSGDLQIELDGRRFRVRDEAGRGFRDLLADVTEPRGFGAVPRTMEGLMDAAAPAATSPTELSGDLDTGEGLVQEIGLPPWPIDATRLAPVAEQVLAADLGHAPVGRRRFLGRDCEEYRFELTGQEHGVPFRSQVRLLVWQSLVLLREVQDHRLRGLRRRVEVTRLG